MSVPINQQKQLIEKYFNLLVKEFITDPRHNKYISIDFQDYIKSSKEGVTTEGNTQQLVSHYTTWQVYPNGTKVPGSEKTTTTYKYVITFLNNYKDIDSLRSSVVHEFAHLYLYSTIGSHDHNDRFYSTMERLENWLNKNQGLSPRVDKSHDRDQYVNDSNSKVDNEENTCPECSYSSPQHSSQCSHNQNQPCPTNQSKWKPDITNDPKKAAEFDSLKNLLNTSQDLAALESAYQKVKNDPSYQEKGYNKKTLDSLYQDKKTFFQYQKYLNNNQRFSTDDSDSSNKSKLGSREYLLIGLTVVAITCLVMIGYLLISNDSGSKTSAKPKKKR